MKITDLNVMKGPNYWSTSHHKIIVIKLDLEELEREPTHKIRGFTDRLIALLPGLESHTCSHGQGGFLAVVEQGTWMAHVAEHIAIELQRRAGLEVSYGKTISTPSQRIYHVLFEYQHEEAGKHAARASVNICQALADGKPYSLDDDIVMLKELAREEQLGPSTGAIVDEAISRGIPCKRMDKSSLFVLGYGNRQKKIRATVAGTTYGLGMEIARDKEETKRLLAASHIPVPGGVLVHDESDVDAKLKELAFPLVMKPLNGNHGRGITTNVRDIHEALEAFQVAARVSTPVIMEEYVPGFDYRLIVVNYKFVAAARRTPAIVTGDGKSTVAELIEQVNADPRRGRGHDNMLTKIDVDAATKSILLREKLTTESILAPGQQLVLKHTANISTGGTAEDVTELIHPHNVFMAERIARIVGLDICGIDIIAGDLGKELDRENGAVVEVNAGPGLRMHLEPQSGLPRNIAKPIVEMLFPKGDRGRIPIVAITGTNGKTTTTRLTAHLASHAGGHYVGFTTTDGIYINGHNIYKGDCTGPRSSEVVLLDPSVDFAVLECARGGLLRSGLAFNECDISIVTNVSADHLGLKDIYTLEEMARVKAVVPATTAANGYAILNADDDLVFGMRDRLSCRIALFSMNAESKRIKRHCRDGGLAAVIEHDYVTVLRGKWKTRIDKVDKIPLTLGGRAESMIKNILPAVLVAAIRDFGEDRIRQALRSFVPSPQLTPGRMNIFDFGDFHFMVDYAHNLDGMAQLKKFMERTKASRKTGIIGIAGDRRDEDIMAFGALSATVFDQIIIRHDSDMRGRSKEEMSNLLMQGIASAGRDTEVKVISSEMEAMQYAIDNALPGSFITICTEKVNDTLDFITEQQKIRKRALQQN